MKKKHHHHHKVKQVNRKAKSIWHYGLVPLYLVLAAPIAAVWLGYQMFMVPVFNSHQKEVLNDAAQSVSAYYQQVFEALNAQAAHLSEDARVISAMSANSDLNSTLDDLSQLDVRLAGVRLAQRGALRVSEGVEPPITYQSIDMARRAQLGEIVPPEIDGDYIYAVAPVVNPGDSGVLGVVFAIYRAGSIYPAFDESAFGSVRLTLNQHFSDSARVIWSLPEGARASSTENAVTVKLNDRWSIQASTSKAISHFEVMMPMIAIALGLGVLCLVVCVVMGVILSSAVSADLTLLNRIVKWGVTGKSLSEVMFKTQWLARAHKGIYDTAALARGARGLGAGLKSLEMMEPMFSMDDPAQASSSGKSEEDKGNHKQE